jgi:hypothetical protein
MPLDIQLLHPERAAHATIRGFLYQTCLGVQRWLELAPDEVLVCEGDEDLDRLIRGGGGREGGCRNSQALFRRAPRRLPRMDGNHG